VNSVPDFIKKCPSCKKELMYTADTYGSPPDINIELFVGHNECHYYLHGKNNTVIKLNIVYNNNLRFFYQSSINKITIHDFVIHKQTVIKLKKDMDYDMLSVF
jgi:hypothetical protein